jgi:hypothetical protein
VTGLIHAELVQETQHLLGVEIHPVAASVARPDHLRGRAADVVALWGLCVYGGRENMGVA